MRELNVPYSQATNTSKQSAAYMKRSYGGEITEVDCISAANAMMQLSRGGEDATKVFECKTCGRRFASFQALGGHRTSHKKPKLWTDEDTTAVAKRKAHECPICGLEYATGQALGGHMRRHRGAAAGIGSIGHGFVEKSSSSSSIGKRVMFDLNFPPEEDAEIRMLGLGLGLFC